MDRAPNDPTTDPNHSRGIPASVAEAEFRAAGYAEQGPLADPQPDDTAAGDRPTLGTVRIATQRGMQTDPSPAVAVVRPGGPNPTADSVGPAGGMIGTDSLIDDHSKAAHPDPREAIA